MPIIGVNKDIQVQEGEILIPEILNADSMEEVDKKFEDTPKTATKVVLNFDKCRRVEHSALKALGSLSEKASSTGKELHVINVNHAQYKALKLSGKIDNCIFPHRGEIPTVAIDTKEVKC